MANAIQFRGMFIRSSHMSNPEGADRTVTLACTADFSTPVMEKMEWADVDKSITSAKLCGKLLSTIMTLTPSDKQLKKFALELDIDTVRDFELVGVRNKEGDITHREIRFTIESSAKDAAHRVELYASRMGRNPGLCKVSYTKQETLDLAEGETEDDGQQDLEESEE